MREPHAPIITAALLLLALSGVSGVGQQPSGLQLPARMIPADDVKTVATLEDEECCYAALHPVSSKRRKPSRIAFLIGAQKSGTTFLFDELVTRHPEIKPQTVRGARRLRVNSAKEPHYFHEIPLRDFGAYLQGFALTSNPKNRKRTFMDGTPDYMHIPSAACRIAATFPNAKIVAVLRDPVTRAMSHWNMVRLMQGKDAILDFDKEVQEELRIMRERQCSYEVPEEERPRPVPRHREGSLWARHPSTLPSWNKCYRCEFMWCGTYSGPPDVASRTEALTSCAHEFPTAGLVRRGLYVYQLEWWLKFFGADNLMVINHEQLQSEPEVVLDKVIAFLGHSPDLKRRSKSVAVDNKLKIEPEKVQDEAQVHQAFQALNVSGWSLPLIEDDAYDKYAEALADLYRYYAYANQELYRFLVTTNISGWSGEFPTSFQAPRRLWL